MTIYYPSLVYRDYNTDGVSGSGKYKPKKLEIRGLLNGMAGRSAVLSMADGFLSSGQLAAAQAGDTTQDLTTPFRNAAIAARALQTGNVLYVTIRIPYGVYSFSDYLPVIRNVIWEGVGHCGATLYYNGSGKPNVIATATLSGSTFTKNTSDNFATLIGGTHSNGGGLRNLIIMANDADCSLNGEKTIVHLNGMGEGILDRVYISTDIVGSINGLDCDNCVSLMTRDLRIDGTSDMSPGDNGFGLRLTGQTNAATPIIPLINYGWSHGVIQAGQCLKLLGGNITGAAIGVWQLGNAPSIDGVRFEGCPIVVKWGDTSGSAVNSPRVVGIGAYSGCTNFLRLVGSLNGFWEHTNRVFNGSVSGERFASDDDPTNNNGNVIEHVDEPVGFAASSVGLGAGNGMNILRVYGTNTGGDGSRYAEWSTETGRRLTSYMGDKPKASLPSSSLSALGTTLFCSDETGGAVLCFNDGTNWRRVTDRAVVS